MGTLFLLFSGHRSLFAQGGTYCGFTYNYAVNNQSASTIFPGGGTWSSGSIIKVSGTFTVDQSISFDDVDFIMAPGAKIIAQGSGTTLTAKNNTHFFGCYAEEMWYGIKVTSSAKIDFSSGVVVEDAWVALEIGRTADIANSKVENTYFYDNMTAIYMVGPGTFKLAKFSGNTIKANGTTLPPPPGYSYSGSKLFRGIYIINAAADLGSNAAKQNKIENYRYGINVQLGKLTIANFAFSNNVNDAGVSDALDGTDIYGYQSTITVGGSGASKCTFFNAANASILCRDIRGLTVTGADFDSPSKYGIKCELSGSLYSPIRITGNTFEMNGTGMVSAIYVERPYSGPNLTNTLIRENIIEVSGGHQKSPIVLIDVLGKKDAHDKVEVSRCSLTVSVDYPQIHGIRVSGMGNNFQVIDENYLSWIGIETNSVNTLKSKGIIATDLRGSDHLIEDNDIISALNDDESFLKAGIHLENNPLSVRVCGNRPRGNYYDIYCGSTGNMGNTFLKTNLIGDGTYGLFCASKSVLPDQDRFENRWVGTTYVNRGAEYGSGAPTFKIYYDPSSTIPDDKPSTVYPTNGWFESLSGSNPECGINNTGLTEDEHGFIVGKLEPDTTTANWDTRRELLYKLIRVPEIVDNDEDAYDYLQAQRAAHTSPWQFARAEMLYDQAYAIATSLDTAFTNMSEAYQMWSDSLFALDLEQDQDTIFDTGIADDRADVFDQLVLVADSLEQLRTLVGPGVLSSLEAALDTVQTLPDTTVFEENLKNILDIALREAIGDSLEESDFDVLRDIAAQCIDLGGISIRRAPVWLEHEEGVAYIDQDWTATCPSPFILKTGEQVPTRQAVRLSPNPANDRIDATFPEKSTGTWQVCNLTGQVLRNGEFSGASSILDVSSLPNGFYLMRCQFGTGEKTINKFSICH